MPRIHLFEVGDQSFVPRQLRDLLTDTLQFGTTLFGFYEPVVPLLAKLLTQTGTSHVVDLCSGATGPWLTLAGALRAHGIRNLRVTFTDKHVNSEAASKVQLRRDPRFEYLPQPVDATAVPEGLHGVRTMFTGFHHFAPREARRVLDDARRARAAIAVFEFTERSVKSTVAALLVPFAQLLTTPLMRPLTWSRLALTYVVPLIPLCSLWDGVVSSLRSYTPGELEALTEDLRTDDYRWCVGRLAGRGFSPTITYLIGTPAP